MSSIVVDKTRTIVVEEIDCCEKTMPSFPLYLHNAVHNAA